MFNDLPDVQMRWAYARADALIAPSHEDFGLTPLEAAAFGVPTVALRGGGYLDTILEGETGLFFDRPTPQEIRLPWRFPTAMFGTVTDCERVPSSSGKRGSSTGSER